jgi:hypothetical protein
VIPDKLYFAGGAADTAMHPIVVVVMALAFLMICILPRKYIIAPALCVIFLIPQGQVIVLAGLHLFPVRLIALFGCVRMSFTKLTSNVTLFAGGVNWIDRAFLFWAAARAISLSLLWMEPAALINSAGFVWSACGMYFLLRFLIQNDHDIERAIKIFAIVAAINAIGMLNEQFRHQNVFGLLGGQIIVPIFRDGRFRSTGVFAHPLLAGSFGATLLPLFLWLWTNKTAKIFAVVGVISSLVMVWTSASSTPILACLGIMLGMCFWPLRENMRAVRWAIVLTLVVLHLVMKAPVWYLLARVDMTGSSSGYHRATLIDTFVQHFSDWWLLGTKEAGSWGFDMWDTSNQFVAEGEKGGILAFGSFIVIIARSFAQIGRTRALLDADSKREWSLWLLGVALVAHLMAYFGVSYFDMTQVAWFALLAIISAFTSKSYAVEARAYGFNITKAHVAPQL